MLFSSLVFLWYFLPAVFLLYFITKNLHIRNGVLLAAGPYTVLFEDAIKPILEKEG